MPVAVPSRLDPLLAFAVAHGASDVHLKAGAHPVARVNGALVRIPGMAVCGPEDVDAFADEILADAPIRRRELDDEGETDVAHARDGIGRFRVGLYRQRGLISIAVRVVPAQPRPLGDLGLPPAVARLGESERGIVLVTGTTGSGKSTTLAAIVDAINRRSHKHIVTVEDPIEVVHTDRGSLINQREVGADTGSFASALRRVLRQDPDVIMIGEIRDTATMEAALQAAETGHLVLSTLHTMDAAETVNRAVGFFPLHEQRAVRAMLAGTLRGIVSQRLVRTADGASRVPACEVLVVTGRARDMIADADQTHRLVEVIREGDYYGMQTFDQSLVDHVAAGRVSIDDAVRAATSPQDFRLMLDAGPSRGRPAPGP